MLAKKRHILILITFLRAHCCKIKEILFAKSFHEMMIWNDYRQCVDDFFSVKIQVRLTQPFFRGCLKERECQLSSFCSWLSSVPFSLSSCWPALERWYPPFTDQHAENTKCLSSQYQITNPKTNNQQSTSRQWGCYRKISNKSSKVSTNMFCWT